MKDYLGDAVYAESNDYGDITLTCEDGISTQERIVLDRGVQKAFLRFLERTGRLKDWKWGEG